MDIDGSTHLVDPKNCKRMGLYKCYMNFYKIFYFNFYMFFYHLIVVLPIDKYFQIYQIIFLKKCASQFNQVRALSLGSWRTLRLSAPGAFTLSLKNLLGMMVLYWIH